MLEATSACTACGEVFPQSMFYAKPGRKSRNRQCITCYRERQNSARRVRRLNAAFRKAEYIKDANRPAARASALYHDIKRRAAKKGLAFSLTKEWIAERLYVCAATRIPLVLARDGTNRTHPFAPSVDRINPAGGYTPDNCQVVCWMYNAARNYHDHERVVEFARALIATEEDRSQMEARAVG